ncbi:LysE family translocator [Brevibacterium litoralis]|uniref:LysE family translocator n=1 Tax=Brevibacterium litoralis TaxID=3138935 RepID=UPI0032EEB0CD
MTGGAWTVLLVTWVMAVGSPGPDFLAVLRTSLQKGRAAGMAVAGGIAAGISIWVVLSLAGVVGLVHQHPTVYLVIRWAGAVFLALYGVQILFSTWRAWKKSRAAEAPSADHTRAVVVPAGNGGAAVGSGGTTTGETGADAGTVGAVAAGEEGDGRKDRDASAAGSGMSVARAARLGFLTNTVGNPKAVVFFSALLVTVLPEGISAWESVAVGTMMVVTGFGWFCLVAAIASLRPVIRVYEKAETAITVLLGALFVGLGVALVPIF